MVHLSSVDIFLILLYAATTLFIGFRSSRSSGSSTTEYLLAGRSLTLPVFVATLVSTWYGGILGVGEFSYRFGISNWIVFGIPYYIFAFVFAVFFAKKIRDTNFTTIPDQLEHAYGKPTAVAGAVLTFLLVNPAAYALMLGLLVQLLFGWGLSLSVITATVVSVLILVLGGFRSDVSTNVFQFVLMFLGFALMLSFAEAHFGGADFLRTNLPPLHLSATGGNSAQFIIAWFFIALWTLVDPAFHQRCYAAKDAATAQRGIFVSILFWAIFDFFTTTTGLYARAAIPTLSNPAFSYPMLAELILPPVAKGIFYIALLATIMSTLSSLTLIGGITVGKDIVGRIIRLQEEDVKGWSNGGIALTTLAAIALALVVPSVVGLWYTVGTCVVPGLLLPVISTYVPRLRIPSPFVLASMAMTFLCSTTCLIIGQMAASHGAAEYPFGIEPMYPGLAVSVGIWVTGLFMGRK